MARTPLPAVAYPNSIGLERRGAPWSPSYFAASCGRSANQHPASMHRAAGRTGLITRALGLLLSSGQPNSRSSKRNGLRSTMRAMDA